MLVHDMLAVATWNPCVTDMIHVANVLYLLSYMVRDILWLRVLSVAAGLCLMPYYCHCGDHPLWAPISWNALFAAVNVVQIVLLVGERWPRSLTGQQRQLYEKIFPELSPGEFVKLMKMGARRELSVGEQLVARGSVVEDMTVLLQGGLEVRADGRVIARLRPGQFVGEMSFVTGEKASADVIATEPSTVVSCSQASLHELLDAKPALALKIRAALGRDVVAKLRAHAGNGA
jgi:hypothetical protein